MNLRQIERRIVVSSRFFTVIAVFGSLIAAVLMFFLGLYHVADAFWSGLRFEESGQFGIGAVISVIEALDRFLIAIVLLYFGFGVYSLFIHPEQDEEELALPAWLRVKQIGQLKQVVAEVIIVVLFVLFLRITLETFLVWTTELSWAQLAKLALLPVSTLLLAWSLKLVELHPKAAHPEDLDALPKPSKGTESRSGPESD